MTPGRTTTVTPAEIVAEKRADDSVRLAFDQSEKAIAAEKDPIQRQIMQGLLTHLRESFAREQARVGLTGIPTESRIDP